MTEYRAPSGALVFCAGTIHWSWGLDVDPRRRPTAGAEPRHAAGHGQRPGRHGRPARHAACRTSTAATAVDRHDGADRDDHLAGRRRDPRRRHRGHRDRHGHRRRRRRRGRRRGLARRRRDLAPGDRDDDLVLHRLARRHRSPRPIQVRATDDSGNLQSPVADAGGRPSSAPARSSGGRHPGARRRAATPAPVEVGVKFSSDSRRLDHRRALLQGRRQHRHPHRQPLDGLGPAPGLGHLHRRDGHGMAAGQLQPTRCRSPRARPTSRPTSHRSGNYSDGRLPTSPTRTVSRTPARAAPTRPAAATAVYRYGSDRLPDELVAGGQLLRRRGLLHDGAAGHDAAHGAPPRRRPAPRPVGDGADHRHLLRAGAASDHLLHADDRIERPRWPARRPTAARPTPPRSRRASALADTTTYTATVSGAKDLAGNTQVSPTQWTLQHRSRRTSRRRLSVQPVAELGHAPGA